MFLRVALAAAGAGVGGAIAGIVLAVIALHIKRLRNDVLVRRGKPVYRDVVFSRAFVPLAAAFSIIVGGALGAFVSTPRAIAIGALAPASLLVVVVLVTSIAQASG